MFGIKGVAQSSKLAYRIFILFVLSALVPIGVLAAFSLQQLTSQQVESVEKELRQKAKNYGLFLNDRLLLLDEKLLMEVERLNFKNKNSQFKPSLEGFSSLAVFTLKTTTTQGMPIANTLSTSDKDSLMAGNPVLLVLQEATGYHSIYLLRNIVNTTKVVAAKIANKYFWGDIETFDLSNQICVYGRDNKAVFCTGNERRQQLDNIKKVWEKVSTGVIKSDGEGIYVSYWRLFTQANFNYSSLLVTVSVKLSDVTTPVAELTNIFIIVCFLVLVIITLLTTIQIRRYFYPLEELMKGIRRVSNNDFKTPVLVDTQDEFNHLADAFNSMSTKVSNQIDFLSAIATIDQHILANRPIKELLFKIVGKLKSTINFVNVGLVVMDEGSKEKGVLYCETSYDASVEILPDFANTLQVNNRGLEIKHTDLPSFLFALKNKQALIFVVTPVLAYNRLEAMLVFSFASEAQAKTVNKQLVELGDRFTIAFEKFAWDKKLYKQAHYDPLTGLPNRQLLNDRLEQAIIQASRDKLYFSLMFLDLDRFKVINDSLGHSSGDELLTLVAKRLVNVLREGDTIARQGGDEFIILLSGSLLSDEVMQRASHVANKILLAITEPYQIQEQAVHISASIGVVLYPIDGGDGETLVKHADAAMYHAKSLGKNNFQLYSSELNSLSIESLKLESELHGALALNQFELYYQPKVDAKTGGILGAEALIRWNHPVDGIVSPFRFIPLAEETGLINKIGEWTIQEACRQMKQWQDEELNRIIVSVNLSVKQFQQKDIVGIVSTALSSNRLEPSFLDLEILEGTAMEDMAKTVQILEEFKSLGVKISIDDYGTGFSTLSYIKEFPIDNLKIDMSFIRNIVNDKGDQAIVASTILLAEKLGLNVVAEGVEDEHQLAILQEMGCNEIQGYYYSPPVPAEKFAKFLKDGFTEKL
ncbi:MAG: hypothetical protein COB62_01230 [Piscirickettsiaceae bacterium]|nr:MAG: hypothetical protein COB62_01230 [Piscirickettsiaceae bacterium]